MVHQHPVPDLRSESRASSAVDRPPLPRLGNALASPRGAAAVVGGDAGDAPIVGLVLSAVELTELLQAKDAAERANEAKSNFLASSTYARACVSLCLRPPCRPMTVFVEDMSGWRGAAGAGSVARDSDARQRNHWVHHPASSDQPDG